MNKKAKDYIKPNILDLESDIRMDSTGKAYGAIAIAEEEMIRKAVNIFAEVYGLRNEFGKKETVDMFERILTQ